MNVQMEEKLDEIENSMQKQESCPELMEADFSEEVQLKL